MVVVDDALAALDGEDDMVVLVGRLVRAGRHDHHAAGHAEVADQHLAVLEVDEQILGAPPQGGDAAAHHACRKTNGKGNTQVGPALLQRDDAAAFEHGLKAAPHGFDFGQFGHAGKLQPFRADRNRLHEPASPIGSLPPLVTARNHKIEQLEVMQRHREAIPQNGDLF